MSNKPPKRISAEEFVRRLEQAYYERGSVGTPNFDELDPITDAQILDYYHARVRREVEVEIGGEIVLLCKQLKWWRITTLVLLAILFIVVVLK